jgi:hypothetical protein
MPQIEPQYLNALAIVGLAMSTVVWLAVVGCTIRYFYLFFVRTREFAALPNAPMTLHDPVQHRAVPARVYALRSGGFVGMLSGLFYAGAAALSWIPRSWVILGDERLWVGYIAAAVLALVAACLIDSRMFKLARRYAELERRIEGQV